MNYFISIIQQSFNWMLTVQHQRVKNNVTNPESKGTPLIQRLREEKERQKDLCSESTDKNRKTAINALEAFCKQTMTGQPSLTLEELSEDHIKAFEIFELREGSKPSYVAEHMRSLRSLINKIIDPAKGCQLFRKVRTSNCQTDKRAVSEEVVNLLKNLLLPENSRMAFARDIFLICFYGMGIPLIDLAFLKKSQLKDGYITYYRQKTHRKVRVKLTPELKELLDRLSTEDSPYLLPILTSEDTQVARKEYRRFYQRYSRALARISEILGNGVHLTSYVARHSWASIAYKNGVDINVIARALGHANTNITYTYIRDIDDSMLADAGRIVCNAVQ